MISVLEVPRIFTVTHGCTAIYVSEFSNHRYSTTQGLGVGFCLAVNAYMTSSDDSLTNIGMPKGTHQFDFNRQIEGSSCSIQLVQIIF